MTFFPGNSSESPGIFFSYLFVLFVVENSKPVQAEVKEACEADLQDGTIVCLRGCVAMQPGRSGTTQSHQEADCETAAVT